MGGEEVRHAAPFGYHAQLHSIFKLIQYIPSVGSINTSKEQRAIAAEKQLTADSSQVTLPARLIVCVHINIYMQLIHILKYVPA